MSKNSDKKTRFVSSKTVVTDEFLNSIYGGLSGTEEESKYSSTDPLVGGHVHDGDSGDGRAQKIDLSKHVTGKLPLSYISGTVEPGDVQAAAPHRSFQFNSADSLGGAETFVFNTSDRSIQLARDHKFFFGSADSTNNFNIRHQDMSLEGDPTRDGYTSRLVFQTDQNTTTADFIFQNDLEKGQIRLQFKDTDMYLFPSNTTAPGEGYLGKVRSDLELKPWHHVNSKELKLWDIQSSYAASRSVTFKLDNTQVDSYSLEMPRYMPSTTDLILKVLSRDGSGNVELTWDTDASVASVGIINNIQLSDGSGGFQSTDWYVTPSNVTPSNTMYPGSNHELGLVGNEVYKGYLRKTPDLLFDSLYDPDDTPPGIIFSDSSDEYKSSINADHQFFHYQTGGSIDIDGTKTYLHFFDSLLGSVDGKSVGLGLGGMGDSEKNFIIRTNRQTYDLQVIELPRFLGASGQTLVIDTIDGTYTMRTSWQTIDAVASVGTVHNIQLSDGSGGFQSTDWYISTANNLYPGTTSYDIGSNSNEVRSLYLGQNPSSNGIIFSNASVDNTSMISAGPHYLEISVAGSTDNNLNLVANNGSATLNLNFYDNDSSHYVGLTSPATINTSHTLVLPERDGDPNHVLITDGSGNLSFSKVPLRTVDFIAPIDPATVFDTLDVRAQIFDNGSTDSYFEIVVRDYDLATVDQQRKIIVTKEGHLIPSTNEEQDLGTTTDRFKDLFLSGSTIWLGERALSFDEETGRIKSLRVKNAHSNNARAYVGKIEETEYSEFEAHTFVIQHEHGKQGERYSARNNVAYETRVTGSVDMSLVGSPFKIDFGEFGDSTYHTCIADVFYKDNTDFYLRSRGITDIFDPSDDPVGIRLNVDNGNDVRVKGVLNINDNYKFPVDKGLTGQVLAVSEGTALVWEDKDGAATDPDGNVIYSDRLISGSHEFILRSDGNLYANRDDFQDIGLANVRFRDMFLNQNLHVDKIKYVDEGRLLSKGSVNSNYIEEKLGDSEERKASYILLPQTTDPYMYFQYVDDGIDENGNEVYNDTENKGRLNLSVLDSSTNLYTSDNISSSGFAFDDNIADKIIFSQDDSTLTWDSRPDGTAYDSSNFAFYFGFRMPKHYNIDNVVDKNADEINNVETIITVTSNESDRFGSPPPTGQVSIDSYLTIGVVKDIGGFEKDVFKFAIGHRPYLSEQLRGAGYVTFTDKNFGVFENYEIPRDGSVVDVCVYFNDDHPNPGFDQNGIQNIRSIAYLYVNSELKDQIEFTYRPSMGAPSKIHIGKSPFGDAPIEGELYYLVNYMSSLDHTSEFISNFQGSIDAVQTQHSEINLDDALIEFKTNKETRLSITNTTIEFFQSYRFPDSSGLDTQVLKTDANGDLYWDFPYDLATLVQEIKDTIDFELGELSDVSAAGAENGEFLVFNGTEWVNQTVEIPLTIPELKDVNVSNVQSNEVLAYVNNSVGWINKSLDELYGIPEVINDLDDVNSATAVSGEFLIHDGTEWVNQTVEIPYNIEELHNVTVTTPMTQDVITWDGSKWVNQDVETILTIPKSINDLDDVDSSSAGHGQLLYYQVLPQTTAEWVPSPTLNHFKGQFMVWQGNRTLVSGGRWVMQPEAYTNPVSGFDEIPTGSLIKWDGDEWVYDTIEIPRLIEDLENVNTISNQTNDVLVWNGTNWHNMDSDTLLGVLAGTVIPENLSDLNIKLLNDLDNVDTSSASDEFVLTYEASTDLWIPKPQAPLEYEFHANGNVLTVDTVINLDSDVSLFVTIDNASNTILYGLNDTIDIGGVTLNGVAGSAGYVMSVSDTGSLEWSKTGMGESNFNVFNSNGLTLTVDTFVNYNYHSNFDISIDKPGYEINIDFANLVQFNSVDLSGLTIGGVVGSTGDILTRSSGGGLEWNSISTVLGSSGISYSAGNNIDINGSNVIRTKRTVDFEYLDTEYLNVNQLLLAGASGSNGQILYVGTGDVLSWSTVTIGSLIFNAGKNMTIDTTSGTTVGTLETVDFTAVNLSELSLDGVYGTTDQYITVNTAGNMVWKDFPVFSSSLEELTDVDIVTANGTIDAKNQQVIKYDYTNNLWKPEYIQDSYYIDSTNHSNSSMILSPTKNYTSYLIDSFSLVTNYNGSFVEILLDKSTDWISGTEISIKNVSRGESTDLKIAWNSSDPSDFVEYSSGTNSQGILLYPDSSVIMIIRKGFSSYEAYIKASHGSIDFYQNTSTISLGSGSANNSAATGSLLSSDYVNLPEESPSNVDLTAPVISLINSHPYYIELGYETSMDKPDPGVTVVDDVDNPIGYISNWSSEVNYNQVGSYTVTYSATDASGKSSSETRTVIVQDTTPPELTLNAVDAVINATYPNGNFLDKVASTFDYSHPVTIVIDTSDIQVYPGQYDITYIATDAHGNTTSVDTTVTVFDYDADSDGILNSRDHFPYDAAQKSDIDGDGVGDASIVILHQDFQNTVNYLEIDDTELINTGPGIQGDYDFEYLNINGKDKFALVVNSSDFRLNYESKGHMEDARPHMGSSSLHFSLNLPQDFDIPSDSSGTIFYFHQIQNDSAWEGHYQLKLKKVLNTNTNETSFRISLYSKAPGGTNNFIDHNSSVSPILNRDLTDYEILNYDPTVSDEYLGGQVSYAADPQDTLKNHLANFDIPNDGEFHAISLAHGSFFGNANCHQVLVYMNGSLKCIFEKTGNFGYQNRVNYVYIYGLTGMKCSDLIWAKTTDEGVIIDTQEKMLNTTLSGGVLINSDDDGDGLANLLEISSGQSDPSLLNTDAVTYPNDQLDDLLNNYVTHFFNGLNKGTNIAGAGYADYTSTYDGGNQNYTEDANKDPFRYFYHGGLRRAGNRYTGESLNGNSAVSFWVYNDGSMSGGTKILKSVQGYEVPVSVSGSGIFAAMGTSGTQNINSFLSSNHLNSWVHILAASDDTNNQTKIYVNSVLFDTINSTMAGGFSGIMWNSTNSFRAAGYTHVGIWQGAVFLQETVQRLYNRGFDAQYDLINAWPADIVSAPDVNISEYFYYHEILSNFDDYISQVQVDSAENYTITISNIGDITFGTIGDYSITYKVETDSGLASYKTQALKILADASDAATYNNLGIIEQTPDGGDVSRNYVLATEYNRNDVLPSGSNSITISNISDSSDYEDGFTATIWIRPQRHTQYGRIFFQFGNFYFKHDGQGAFRLGNPGGSSFSRDSNAVHIGTDNNRWTHITVTWHKDDGVKLYSGSISDTNLSAGNYQNVSFGLVDERVVNTNAGVFSTDLSVGFNDAEQRAMFGAQIAKRIMTSSEIYSYIRKSLEDQDTLLG